MCANPQTKAVLPGSAGPLDRPLPPAQGWSSTLTKSIKRIRLLHPRIRDSEGPTLTGYGGSPPMDLVAARRPLRPATTRVFVRPANGEGQQDEYPASATEERRPARRG